jgi:hypothetical protein
MAAQQVMSPGCSCTLVISLRSALHAALILPMQCIAGHAYALTHWYHPAEHAPAVSQGKFIAQDLQAQFPRRDGLKD